MTLVPPQPDYQFIQNSTPSNPKKSDWWLDTSTSPPKSKVYDGGSFVRPEEVEFVDARVSNAGTSKSKIRNSIHAQTSDNFVRNLPDWSITATVGGGSVTTDKDGATLQSGTSSGDAAEIRGFREINYNYRVHQHTFRIDFLSGSNVKYFIGATDQYGAGYAYDPVSGDYYKQKSVIGSAPTMSQGDSATLTITINKQTDEFTFDLEGDVNDTNTFTGTAEIPEDNLIYVENKGDRVTTRIVHSSFEVSQ